MSTFIHRDFSAGWTPSDSPLNGRANGLLVMNNLELDQNGDLAMIGGVKTVGTAYSSNAHTLFSKWLTNTNYRYVATLDGNIYRNNTSIATGGSATRGAFGYGFDYVLAFSGDKRYRDDGATATALGQVKPASGPTVTSAGAGVLTGDYDYVQINLFVNGAYIAKSAIGPSTSITLTGENATVTGTAPTSPANETWIFRRGGNLDQYYRIKRLTASYTSSFTDSMSDDDALTLGITLNLLALSVNSTDLSDAIIGVVGPINQRMLYFTKDTCYFSEINSPETYDPNRGIKYSSNTGTEIFLWAKQSSENVVMIGTNRARYRLTGTYITLPDGSIDVQLITIDDKFPPIGLGADRYNGGICYISSNGWRIGYQDGTSELLVAPSLDRLYRGNSIRTAPTAPSNPIIPGVPIYPFPATDPVGGIIIYDCAVTRNKMYCLVPTILANNPTIAFGGTIHVYDFERKYWRVGQPLSCNKIYGMEDGTLIGFDTADSKIKELEYQFAKTNDGSQPSITAVFNIWDFGYPDQRKDFLTLKIKCYTGASSSAAITYSLDDGITFSSLGGISSTTLKVTAFDLSALARSKTIMIKVSGSCDDFILSWIMIEHEVLPVQTTYNLVQRFDMPGLDGKKFRPRTWPIIIDTLGNNVTFTPSINGADQTTSTLNTSGKTLVHHFFKADAPIPLNLGYKFTASQVYELYQVLFPEMVQVFPMAKQFDQLGPEHFFKLGKLKSLSIRLLSDSTANIPWKVFMQDVALPVTGNIAAIANVEDSYDIPLGKENLGTILRIELGPTSFNFYRYYALLQVNKSGKDSDMEWIPVGMQTNG